MNGYAAVGLAFFIFVLCCFAGIGSKAEQFLCILAFLELQQHDACFFSQLFFQARCLRQTCMQISAALVKATVMCLTGEPSFPAPTYFQHWNCAWKCPLSLTLAELYVLVLTSFIKLIRLLQNLMKLLLNHR